MGAAGTIGTDGTDGTVTTTGEMDWDLRSIMNSQNDTVWQSVHESEPEAKELKSLPQALPQALPKAKSVKPDMSIASEIS